MIDDSIATRGRAIADKAGLGPIRVVGIAAPKGKPVMAYVDVPAPRKKPR